MIVITRDGCVSTTFHQKCDNQGPTVTVLYNPQGSVYGGYVQVSWNSNGSWYDDTAAFLYQLRFNGNDKRTKFPIQSGNSKHALYCGSTYGSLFGASNDLLTFTNTVNSSGTYFALNGQMNIGNTYDNKGVTAAQINNGNMNVTELEVYKVEGKMCFIVFIYMQTFDTFETLQVARFIQILNNFVFLYVVSLHINNSSCLFFIKICKTDKHQIQDTIFKYFNNISNSQKFA
jgi:hypothetical protein